MPILGRRTERKYSSFAISIEKAKSTLAIFAASASWATIRKEKASAVNIHRTKLRFLLRMRINRYDVLHKKYQSRDIYAEDEIIKITRRLRLKANAEKKYKAEYL